jgi:ankyrin repeat protein
MNRTRHKRIALLVLLLLALLIVVSVGLVWRVVRQKRLDQALIVAVKANETQAAIALLRAGADANVKNVAVSISLSDVLRRLLDQFRGVPPPQLMATGLPLLTLAVDQHNVALARALLDHGAQVDAVEKSIDEATPLLHAVDDDQVEMVRLLLEHHANPNARDELGGTALMNTRNAAILKMLLDRGADVRIRLTGGKVPGRTALLCHADDVPMMRQLITRGAEVGETDDAGDTLLMLAADSLSLPGIDFAVHHGLRVNASNHDGQTALMQAADTRAEGSRCQALQELLRLGADSNLTDTDGQTALILSAMRGDPDSVGVLLRAGAKINVRDRRGMTALGEAMDMASTGSHNVDPGDYKGCIARLKAAGAKE